MGLVRAIGKPPVVSNISAKQRLHWHKLTDAQLREREIRHLTITLDSRNRHATASGEQFSHCIGAISRRGYGTKIHLRLYGDWHDLLNQFQGSVPNVRKLELCLERVPDLLRRLQLWDQCFGGSIFPDLQEIDLDTAHPLSIERYDTLETASRRYDNATFNGFHPGPFPGHRRRSVFLHPGPAEHMPFHGLRRLMSIKLRNMQALDESVLQSLFGSNIRPQSLTRLELSFCPLLNLTTTLEALSVLLQRGLPLLQYLKLHLNQERPESADIHETKYCRAINEHPEQHLCNVSLAFSP